MQQLLFLLRIHILHEGKQLPLLSGIPAIFYILKRAWKYPSGEPLYLQHKIGLLLQAVCQPSYSVDEVP